MAEVCPYTAYEHGADKDYPLGTIRAVVLHRTGNFGWAGNRAAGLSRMHNTPGTFQFLIGRDDDEASQFYPANCYCSHAAGANQTGPGVEFEGPNGEPLTAWQLAKGAQVIGWLADTFGIPRTFYDGDRIAVEDGTFSGFITHRAVATIPQYQHYDYIEQSEWDAMMASPTGDDFLMGLTQVQQDGIYQAIQALVEGQWYPPADTTYHLPVVLTKLDEILRVLALTAPGGLTEEQVRQIVRDELDRTKIKPGTMRVRELGT